jgi:hypothetical protein
MTNTKISRDDKVVELAAFWNSDFRSDEQYEEFVFVFGSVCELADQKQVGWVSEISELGYKRIELAYDELAKTDWFGETNGDIF